MTYKISKTGDKQYAIYKHIFVVWKRVHTVPSFSLARHWLRELGVKSFVYEEL